MRFIFIIIVLLNYNLLYSNTFIVTNTNDSGTGSLREAITYANYTPGTSHSITFNIPTSDISYNSTIGVWVIKPTTPLPYITRANITFDGNSQTINQGDNNPFGPEIQLDGNNNTIDYGFSVINVAGITIKGFCITNFLYGIQIYGINAKNCNIHSCYIGVNPTSTDTAGNYIGIEIIQSASINTIGSTNFNERNIVSGNKHIGIRVINANNNIIAGNFVGTDKSGTFALPNYDGISIEGTSKYNMIGGFNSNLRNIVSGNYAYGIPIFGSGADSNYVYGNYIGTDINGTNSIPNTYGVLFDDGARYNQLGSSQPGSTNIISGNSGYGVFIYNMGTNSNLIKGNYIGTDKNGNSAVPNGIGIVIDGAAFNHKIDSNIISGNIQQGIAIHITGSDGNIITRNKIGLDINNNSLANNSDGIRIAEGPKNTIIGGSEENANIIAYNLGVGISIMSDNDTGHKISKNSIYSNTGLGIDLYPPDINLNDLGDNDIGPNNKLNYPVITNIEHYTNNNIKVSGVLDTQNSELCKIELYISDNDNSGHGEGKHFVAETTPDITGIWSINCNINEFEYITALTIDNNGNTSEFSENFQVLYTNINSLINVGEIVIFPNPSDGELFINNEIHEFNILNSYGQIIKNYKINNNEFFDISDLPKGLYFININSKNYKIIKN